MAGQLSHTHLNPIRFPSVVGVAEQGAHLSQCFPEIVVLLLSLLLLLLLQLNNNFSEGFTPIFSYLH